MNIDTPLSDMIIDYLAITGKQQLDYEIMYIEGKGFITYMITGTTMVIPDLYGDGKFWLDKALEIARSKGCTKLRGGTTRNPKAYNKMFGTKIIGYVLEREV